jgi:predicted phage terminase large subunit-like protein
MTAALPTIPADAIVIRPQPGPQTQFLSCDADVVFYGGSAGGGKTFALLLDDLYNIDNPKYGSVIFRRTTKQITSEGGLWDTATDLYVAIGGVPKENPYYHFDWPSGMKIAFSHMEHEKNRLDWQGSQIAGIKFDEICHFTWKQFSYMLSRNRSDSGVKGTIRGTCNPDPDSWVRKFIDWYIGEDGYVIKERSGVIRWFCVIGDEVFWGDTRQELIDQYGADTLPLSFTFIRSSLEDNQILMKKDPGYKSKLMALPRVERAQLMEGNWNIRATAGSYFRREDFEIVNAVPAGAKRVRAWDLAGTKREDEGSVEKKKERGPAFTAGVKIARVGGVYFIENVSRFRVDASKVLLSIKNVATQDGKTVKVRLPQDPGQAGKSQAKSFTKDLSGWPVVYYSVSGSKEARATPLASQAQAGNVKLVAGIWNEAFLSEAENFPEGLFKDQIDAAADAFDELTNTKRIGVW